MTERYLKGEVTLDELERAYSAAYRARYSAAYSVTEWATCRAAYSAACRATCRATEWAVEADPTIARAVIDYGIKLIEEAGE
jgi:hypothetical protein